MTDDEEATADRIAALISRIRAEEVDGRKLLVVLIPKGTPDADIVRLKERVDRYLDTIARRPDPESLPPEEPQP